MGVREFRASVKEIQGILRHDGNIYSIPRYQRGYAWTRSQLQTLWTDILEEEYPGMFIGTILLNHGEYGQERIEVIDGQQRLLTIAILFSSIRDKLSSLGQGDAALQIQEYYIAASPGVMDEKVPKIEPGPKLLKEDYFQKRIQDYPLLKDSVIPKPINHEQSRVNAARSFFDKSINLELKKEEEEVQQVLWLKQLSNKIEKLTVVAINVEDEQDAYTVFESVNAKGASLTLADILKNMIFRKIPKSGEVDVAQEQWDQILKNLEDCSGFSMSKFIRYYWLSKFEFLTESKLYEAIKNELVIKKSLSWEDLLGSLVDESDRLKKLMNVQSTDFLRFKVSQRSYISQALDGISKMGVSQVYVLLLSMHRNSTLKEKWKLDFEFLEKFCFNYHTISKLQAVRVERKYSNYARMLEDIGNQDLTSSQIQKKLEKTLSLMKKELLSLKNEFVTRENFVDRFTSEINYSSNKTKKDLLRYVLIKIDAHLADGTGELKINPENTNLEHILPQKPSRWGLDEKAVSDYVDNIGNLTILSRTLNAQGGNKPLLEKMPELKSSELVINKHLVEFLEGENLEWDEERIRIRGESLAELAYDSIWNL